MNLGYLGRVLLFVLFGFPAYLLGYMWEVVYSGFVAGSLSCAKDSKADTEEWIKRHGL